MTEAQVGELLKIVRKKGKNSNTARNSRSRKEAEVGKQDNLVIRDTVIEIKIKTMTMTMTKTKTTTKNVQIKKLFTRILGLLLVVRDKFIDIDNDTNKDCSVSDNAS